MKDNALALLMDAVADMRHAQREYFRTCHPTSLKVQIRAEAKVDKLLAELSEPRLPGM